MYFIVRFLRLVGQALTLRFWEQFVTRPTQSLPSTDSITIPVIHSPQYGPAGPLLPVTDLGFPATPLINFPPYLAPRLPSSNTDLILAPQHNVYKTWFDDKPIAWIMFIFVTYCIAHKFFKFDAPRSEERQSRESPDFEVQRALLEAELRAANVKVAEKDGQLKNLKEDCIRKHRVIKAIKNLRTRDKGIIPKSEKALQDALDELPPLKVKFIVLHNATIKLQQENADLKTVEMNLRQEIKTQAEARTRDREEGVTRHEEASNALRGELKESEREVQLLLNSQTKFQAEARLLRDSDAKLQLEVTYLRSIADEAEEWRDEYKMQAEASAASLALRVKELRKKDMEGSHEVTWLRESQMKLRKAYKLIVDADRRAAASEEDAVSSKKCMKEGQKALSSLQDDHQKLSVKYETAAKQLLELESELSKEKTEVVEYIAVVSDYDNQFGKQLEKNKSLYAMNKDLQMGRVALIKEKDAVIKANEDLAEKNKQLHAKDQNWKVAFDRSRDLHDSTLDERNKEINEVKRKGNEYYHANRDLQQSLEKEQKKLQDCQVELATVKTELTAMKTELDTVKARPDTSELDTVKTKLVIFKTELDAVKKVLAATKSDAKFQERAFEELNEKHETGKTKFKRMEKGYNQKCVLIETLQAQIKSLEDDQEKTKTSNAAKPAASKQLQSQMMNLQHVNAMVRKEKDALQFQANCMNIGFSQLRILGIYPVEPLNRNGKGLNFVDFVKVDPRRHDLSAYKTDNQFPMVYRNRREDVIKDFDRSSCSYLRAATQRRRHSITYGEQTTSAAAFHRPGDVQKRSGMKMPLHRNQQPGEDSRITYHTKSIMAAVNRLAKYPPGAKRLEIADEDDIVLILSEREPYEDVELRENLGHLWSVQDNILKHICNSQGVRGPLGNALTIDNVVEQKVVTERKVAHWGQMRDIHDMHVDWRARETRVGWIHDEIVKWCGT